MKVVFILIGRRVEEAVKVQSVLSEFGDIIKTRLGINRELSQQNDASGFIFLELCGDDKRGDELCQALNKMPDVKAECLQIELPNCSCTS
jgi:hypothetical protein